MTTPPNPRRGFRFPAEVIEHAVWLYHPFSLSLRDVETILVARGVVVRRAFKIVGGGDHAAAVIDLWSSLAGRKPGWRWRNASSSVSFSTAVRTLRKGCTVALLQRICCILFIRLATISLTALPTNAVKIG